MGFTSSLFTADMLQIHRFVLLAIATEFACSDTSGQHERCLRGLESIRTLHETRWVTARRYQWVLVGCSSRQYTHGKPRCPRGSDNDIQCVDNLSTWPFSAKTATHGVSKPLKRSSLQAWNRMVPGTCSTDQAVIQTQPQCEIEENDE